MSTHRPVQALRRPHATYGPAVALVVIFRFVGIFPDCSGFRPASFRPLPMAVPGIFRPRRAAEDAGVGPELGWSLLPGLSLAAGRVGPPGGR